MRVYIIIRIVAKRKSLDQQVSEDRRSRRKTALTVRGTRRPAEEEQKEVKEEVVEVVEENRRRPWVKRVCARGRTGRLIIRYDT